MLISIIIPCFNDGKYIKETIESVNNQTYKELEVIIVDDASTDGKTKKVLSELKQENLTVIYMEKNAGPSIARNKGIEFAKGQYILPLDADDKIAPTYIEKAKKVLDEQPKIGIVYCEAELFGKQTGKWNLPSYSFPEILVGNMIFATAMFKKEDWKKVGGYNENMFQGNEDYDFWLSLLELKREVHQIPEILFSYRIKETSRTTRLANNKQNEIDSFTQIFHNHEKFYTQNISIFFEELKKQRLFLQEKDQQIQEKEQQLQEKDQVLNNLLNSNSIKITRPIRQIAFVSKTLMNFKKDKLYVPGTDEHRFAQAIKRRIPQAIFYKIKNFINKEQTQVLADMPWSKPLNLPSRTLGQNVLIVAELSIPQCKKYRVDQKVEMLKTLGYDANVVSWTDYNKARNLLQLSGMVIFYRVPAHDIVKKLINEASRLGISSFFDVDDLVFDKKLLKENINIQQLDKSTQKELYKGADLYKEALSLTQHTIASTPVLSKHMSLYNSGECYVVPNCLDHELLQYVTDTPKTDDGTIKIVYGSGTSTHDIDFLEVSDALVALLKKYANLQFVIHGTLSLPESFETLSAQIKKIPFMKSADYYAALQNYDINIAPLEPSVFNDAKSNIKFLEASVFKLPTVASSVAEYEAVIEHGNNGFLSSNTQEWLESLENLILSKEQRIKIGNNAYRTAIKQYEISTIAKEYFSPLLLKHIPHPQNPAKKILMANVLFNPISFGGATIVIEELSKLINKKDHYDVTVFTGFFDPMRTLPEEYDLVRYEVNGVSVILMRFPEPMLPELEYKNEAMERVFDDLLTSLKPDLVHFHSIQQLSASIANPCKKRGIPYAITLHDMWWLCEKQFMVMPNNKYCHQTKIDTDYCINHCTHNAQVTHKRDAFLKPILQNADLLLTPSAFQKDMYAYNDIDRSNIKVNKNGIQFPNESYKKTKSDIVRFAYLGGNAVHKGYEFVKEIFESIEASGYELVLTDLHRKLGHNSIFEDDWDIKGKLTIVDGYEYGQKGLDDFFASIDVLLFPSQWKESFGLTVREALVRDVWVLSTDAGGVIEDIVESENGNVVDINDKESFRAKIMESIERKEFFATYSNPYKNKIRSYDEQADELVSYYENLV